MNQSTKGMGPVAHSVIESAYLASEVDCRYALPGPLRGFLLYRGMNDVYLIQGRDARYALRVWRRSWRAVEVVLHELQFLEFLRSRGFPASSGIRARDDNLYFKLESPEGPRAVALYDWAPGRKFGDCLDEGIAERIGAAFARDASAGTGVECRS